MALRPAVAAHPIQQMAATAFGAAPAPEPIAEIPPAPTPAKKPKKVRPKPRTLEAVKPTQTGRLDLPTMPALVPADDVPVAEPRPEPLTLRGKREISLLIPAAVVEDIQTGFRLARPVYRRLKADQPGEWRLTLSAFTTTAFNWALDHSGDWAHLIPNDARHDPSQREVPRRQIGLTWPQATVDRFHEAWEVLDASGVWGSGFTLTKSNLAATAIVWALPHLEEWLDSAPNDDRFSQPVAGDRRLRT